MAPYAPLPIIEALLQGGLDDGKGWLRMNQRENMTAILEGRQQDYYGNFFNAVKIVSDPIRMADVCPADGQEHRDSWGTTCIRLPDAPGKHPHITDENKVVKDIEKWREQLVIPPVQGLDWSKAKAEVEALDRNETFVMFWSAQGLFERSHFLMGMEDAFCAYLEDPDEMTAMLRAIADFKIASIREAYEQIRPDIVYFHDDWGSKQNLFLPPEVWREVIKPLHAEIVQATHDLGMMFIHHADCICEPLVEDMVEMGIDAWQGVIPQNDIVAIQRRTGGKLAMIGGVDSAAIDTEEATEEEIRAEVRRCIDEYCPAGRFFPALTSHLFHKRNSDIALEELASYGRAWAAAHPVA